MKDSIIKNQVILPGGNKQFNHLLKHFTSLGESALIIGPGCESIANRLLTHYNEVTIIVNDYDSLMHTKLNVKGEEKIKVKMMDYVHTDFEDGFFDLIYAQGSISVTNKKNIVKEIKRILKMNGIFCSGEIVPLKEPVPAFVKDIWELSGLEPLALSEIKKLFANSGFELVNEEDLSYTLKEFYEKTRDKVSKAGKKEKEEHKKIFTRIRHEANAYLKLGGDKFIGFKSLIMRKVN